ncbi:MAG: hypothetical protein JXB85_14920 [Anaerolineales bacterium]|nr:hypothetical protein [Anaerolineales bacterium]
MKKTLVLMVTLVLVFALATPVLAGGKGPGTGSGGQGSGQGQQDTRGTFAITGTITAIGANTVTVQVYRGNTLVQPFLGTPVTVTVSSATRYLFKSSTSATATAITFADLRVGNPVSVNGTVANDIWTATRITVGASLSCLP